MNRLIVLTGLVLTLANYTLRSQEIIVTSDIDHFWSAYDRITATDDSTVQYKVINEFIEKGSAGLHGMMQARNYAAESYVDAINSYPKFWNSIRANTFRAKELALKIEMEIQKLKLLYPELKPATIYFTIGALRSNGTTIDGMVLIGSELAMADQTTDASEFPEDFSFLKNYFATEPIKNIVFLNVHEYIHTQQITTIGNNLLQQCVIEGVAEFLAVKATGQESPNSCIQYGILNDEAVKQAFISEMFSPYIYNWLWNDSNNQFQTRDLGYYIGYKICQQYYEQQTDKQSAIKTLIELDYTNAAALQKFVNQSGYFNEPIQKYESEFEKSRPVVTGIKEFKNGSKKVDPAIKEVTLFFSTEMDSMNRSFELGPLGEDYLMRIENVIGFSKDGKAFTFQVELQPNRKYQLVVGSGFLNAQGIPMKPYLIEFETTN